MIPRNRPEWAALLAAAAISMLAVAGCHKPVAPPVDDTASDAAALPAPPAMSRDAVQSKPSPVPRTFKAVGTEPFWGAEVDGQALVYSTPEFVSGIRITVTRRETADGAEYVGALDGKPLMLKVAAGQCSDGMSDRIYRFTAVREIGPDIARGCAD